MSVEELSQLHRRYIELSDRFKAAWTFHQFLQGVHKVFVDENVGRDPISFQELYASLKGMSQNLNTAATQELREQLDRLDKDLRERLQVLVDEDSRVSPSLLRQFFQRVKSYDEKILVQLLRFYALTHSGDEWTDDRLDKVDFLITKLGEQIQDLKIQAILRDPTRVHEIFQSLWSTLNVEPVTQDQIEAVQEAILAIRKEITGVENLDELNQRECVRRYRDFKHELGSLLFEPQIAPLILEANLVVRHAIQDLYQLEERRITTEYLEVFELERDATPDTQLDLDLKQFRQEIEAFEGHLQAKNVRLEELAYIRNRVRTLIPRLREAVSSKSRMGETGVESADESVALAPSPAALAEEEILEPYLEKVRAALENADVMASPRAVTVSPGVQPLRLLTRDVVAFRRLEKGTGCNVAVESFVLEVAALRLRINEEAEEIASTRALSSEGADEELIARARETTRLADSFEKRLSHFMTQALQDGELTSAQELQVLRIRLLRDYTGLWLVAHNVT